jgi:hypothetical protein
VGVVHSPTRQFVLLIGTLLSFGNGGSLCAGLISLSTIDDGAPVNNESWDVPSQPEMHCASQTSLLAESLVSRASDHRTFQDRSASQCRGASQDVLPTDPRSSNASQSSGLPSDEDAPPANPYPAAPSGGGATGTAGFTLGGSKMQQDGLINWYNPPTSERHGNATSYSVQFKCDATPLSIFRPPRLRSKNA